MSRFAHLLCVTLLSGLFTSSAYAQTSGNDDKPVTAPSATLAKVTEPKTPNEARRRPLTAGDRRHTHVTFTTRLETDLRTANRDLGLDAPRVGWDTRRVGVQGQLFERVEFEMERELSSTHTPWKDAFVDVRWNDAAQFRAGRFKVPFGRDELTSGGDRDFIQRSLLARVVAPGRDSGAMVHGRILNRKIHYQSGYFRHDGDHARSVHTSGAQDTIAARLVLAPFASEHSKAADRLQIGVAATHSQIANRLGLEGRTVFGDGVFFDRVFVNGRRLRVGVEAASAIGALSFAGEYNVFSDQRRGLGTAGQDLSPLSAHGWHMGATWAVTGERKHGRVTPRHALFRGGIGAFEVAARVEALRFGALTSPSIFTGADVRSIAANVDRAGTIGVNWYLDRYVKLQSNVVIESIADPGRSPAPRTEGRFISTIFRLQFIL